MKLSEKYYKIYMRFLKEECPKYVSNSKTSQIYNYKDITSNRILPHLYSLPNNKRKLFVKTILNEYSNDIISLLNNRLDLIDYNKFKLIGYHFNSKKTFIEFITTNGFLHLGLNIMDKTIRPKIEFWSYDIINMAFFENYKA